MAGRPKIGTRRTVGVTLEDDLWDAIDHEFQGENLAQALRVIITNYYTRQIDISEVIKQRSKEMA